MNRCTRKSPLLSARIRACLGALGVTALLFGASGCGQKGALYLPEPKPQAVPPTATQPPAANPAATDEGNAQRKLPRAPDPATSH